MYSWFSQSDSIFQQDSQLSLQGTLTSYMLATNVNITLGGAWVARSRGNF